MGSEYTPTTEQVRDAYVRGMRDAFVASTGEHYAEFDRWFAKVGGTSEKSSGLSKPE